MKGLVLIEVVIALALLSLIACGTAQYFAWMSERSRRCFEQSRAAAATEVVVDVGVVRSTVSTASLVVKT